jgi:hypothetical protein
LGPGRARAIMLPMNRSAANASVSCLPRRFILLPEVEADAGRHGPRIRRYRLTTVGLGAASRRSGHGGADIVTARTARDLGPLDRMS